MNSRLVTLAAFAWCCSSLAQTHPKPSNPPVVKPADDAQLYRNSTFGFRYRTRYGWVDRTKEMQEGNDGGSNQVLLAVFERPPEATGDTINSAVVIAAEKATAYPGLKKAEDYLGPLTEITTSKGFKVEGDPSELEVGSQRMVRADFVRALNEKLTMHQSTLVLLSEGQIVSFTFVAESVDAVNDLIDGISFSSPKLKAK